MIIAATGKAPDDILEDDYLEIITDLQLEPRIIYPNGFKRVNRFAFVIHPLSQEYFKNIKPIELLSHVSPPVFMDTLEKAMAYAPPFVYSKVTGIKSPTGVEAEGWLISVGGTPEGDHEPQPRVHLPPPAGCRADGQAARRADHGPGRVHQGGRRRRPHRGPARAAADHDGQQLQRLRRAVGRARRGAAPWAGARADARPESAVQGDGRRRHRRHRLGVRAPARDGRRGGLPGVAGDGQAAVAQGVDPEGDARGASCSCPRAPTRTSPTWT